MILPVFIAQGSSVVIGAAAVSFAMSAGSTPFIPETVSVTAGVSVDLKPVGFVQLLLGTSDDRAQTASADGIFALVGSLKGLGLFAKPYVVYSRVSETVGLLLAFITRVRPPGWNLAAVERLVRAALLQIYKVQLDSKATAERGPIRFLVCTTAIASHFPGIVDRSIAEFALQALVESKGRLYTRGKVLELIAEVIAL